ncbi:MAG: amidase family protein [Rubrivivax sp.]
MTAVFLAEYTRHDATALANLIRVGDVSAREVLECAVSAAQHLNPRLNAVCEWMVDQAFAELERVPAGAPLAGVPFMVKDLLIRLEGRACTQGSRLVRPAPAPQDSELMRRFRQCGLVAFAKATTPAFGAHVTTEGLRTGDTEPPRILRRLLRLRMEPR